MLLFITCILVLYLSSFRHYKEKSEAFEKNAPLRGVLAVLKEFE